MFPRLLLALTLTAVAAATAPAIELPGVAPGPAKATLDGPRLAMENAVLQARWDLSPDSRGIGGDPGKGEVYGFASWTPRMGYRGSPQAESTGAEVLTTACPVTLTFLQRANHTKLKVRDLIEVADDVVVGPAAAAPP